MVSEWLAEARPDLKFPHEAPDAPDVHVAHCPERVLPGRIMVELVTNDRIVGGITPECARRAAEVYALFCKGEILFTGAETAEIAKLVENSFRDVNIAFANELAGVCETARTRRLGGHQAGQPSSPGQRSEARPRSRRPLHRGRPVVHRGGRSRANALIRAAREINDARPAERWSTRCPGLGHGNEAPIAASGWRSRPTSTTCARARQSRSSRPCAIALPDATILAVEPYVD